MENYIKEFPSFFLFAFLLFSFGSLIISKLFEEKAFGLVIVCWLLSRHFLLYNIFIAYIFIWPDLAIIFPTSIVVLAVVVVVLTLFHSTVEFL